MPVSSTSTTLAPKTLSRNMALSLLRVGASSVVALVLPAYLTHRFPVATYAAWVLILQLAALVSYLDFGVQTAVSKFVAEHEAKGDLAAAGRYASAGLAIIMATACLGALLTLGLAWQVPRVFSSMPSSLYRDVRISVVLIGISLSWNLLCSVFSAVFLGLQNYAIPTAITLLNRAAYMVVVLLTVFFHKSLAVMGAWVAAVHMGTGSLQIVAWHKKASHVRISVSSLDLNVLKEMVRYCFLLSIWVVGVLCVTGLDVTIVGHYDFGQAAYYSTATLPVSFLLLILSSLLGPMMPASSALSTQSSASELGDVLAKTTRYTTVVLLLTGLPLVVYGYPILKLWVGPLYAAQAVAYLRILVIANVLRNLFAPYATMVVATGQIWAATAAPVAEALVNLASSIYLARHYGALGVAVGTLLGSVVSISLHLLVSMHYTARKLAVARSRLVLLSILRPAIAIAPSVLLLVWWQQRYLNALVAGLWGLSTLILIGLFGLLGEERIFLARFVHGRLLKAVRA